MSKCACGEGHPALTLAFGAYRIRVWGPAVEREGLGCSLLETV